MKIYHILKKSGKDTLFRKIILKSLNALKSKSDKSNIVVYIASGFYSENTQTQITTFQCKDTQTTLANELVGLNVELFGAFSKKTELLQVGSNLKARKINVKVFYKYHFHSKLFIITIAGKPVLEIIGSSNMTTSAYEGLRTYNSSKSSLNTESDLVIIDDEILNVSVDVNDFVMEFEYSNDKNNQITLENKMFDILDYLNELKNQMKNITNEIK